MRGCVCVCLCVCVCVCVRVSEGGGAEAGPACTCLMIPPMAELMESNVIGPTDTTWSYTPPGLTLTDLSCLPACVCVCVCVCLFKCSILMMIVFIISGIYAVHFTLYSKENSFDLSSSTRINLCKNYSVLNS